MKPQGEIEAAIYATAYVRAFYETNRDKTDEERSRLAKIEAEALVRQHRATEGA